jgi:xanthine dehydrogenase accessory factor
VDSFAKLAQLEEQGRPFALVIVIQARGSVPRHARSKMLVFPDGSAEGTIGGGEMEGLVIREALEALLDGKTRLLHYNFNDPGKGDPGVCGGEIDVYVEPVQAKPSLLIFGAGHVGKAVAHLGKWAGFHVIVGDDREEFATEDNVPEAAQTIHCDLSQLAKHVEIDPQTYIILTTREVSLDVEGLPNLLKTSAAYIGVIGSRRRWETTAKKLLEEGVTDEMISRVTSPMGLEINAETPEEIALSILSEIIMLRRGGTGDRMAHNPSVGRVEEGT